MIEYFINHNNLFTFCPNSATRLTHVINFLYICFPTQAIQVASTTMVTLHRLETNLSAHILLKVNIWYHYDNFISKVFNAIDIMQMQACMSMIISYRSKPRFLNFFSFFFSFFSPLLLPSWKLEFQVTKAWPNTTIFLNAQWFVYFVFGHERKHKIICLLSFFAIETLCIDKFYLIYLTPILCTNPNV